MADLALTFHPSGRSAAVRADTSLLEAAAAAGLRLHSPCGGRGRCGKCAVQAPTGLGEPTVAEKRVFTAEQIAQGWRLACQARVVADAEVTVPASSVVTEHRIVVEGVAREILIEPYIQKIALRLPPPSVDDPRADLNRVTDALGTNIRPPAAADRLRSLPSLLRRANFEVTAVIAGDQLLALEPGDTSHSTYGVAIDIGTTTVVVYLCRLDTGELVQVASDLNPQARYGDDVISRIHMAVSDRQGAQRLSRLVVELIDDLIARAARGAGVPRDAIYDIAVVGNTCMSHLFLGVPPAGLAGVPFVPAFRGPQTVRAADLGIHVHPEALVFVVPNIGGFVGADTVGVILASELDRADALRVAVDIGTNGEIVVARGGDLYACSTAAGPAFEGARISRGMRAAAGAIDAVTIPDDVRCHVIGDVPARGICGSGLVDAVAELVKVGAVTEQGRMRRPDEAASLPEKVRRRLVENEDSVQFILAWGEEAESGEPVAITARDVREMQLAKAAIYGGMALMLDELGVGPRDIQRLLLAGAFGNYITKASAVAIGLIPDLDLDRIESIGNAAGVGARLVLSSVSERRRAEEIARRTRHVHLSQREGFYDRFADAMMLRPLPAQDH